MRELAGLLGICIALAISVTFVDAVMMAAMSPRILRLSAAGLGRLAAVVVVLAIASFALTNLVLAPIPAAMTAIAPYLAWLALALFDATQTVVSMKAMGMQHYWWTLFFVVLAAFLNAAFTSSAVVL